MPRPAPSNPTRRRSSHGPTPTPHATSAPARYGTSHRTNSPRPIRRTSARVFADRPCAGAVGRPVQRLRRAESPDDGLASSLTSTSLAVAPTAIARRNDDRCALGTIRTRSPVSNHLPQPPWHDFASDPSAAHDAPEPIKNHQPDGQNRQTRPERPLRNITIDLPVHTTTTSTQIIPSRLESSTFDTPRRPARYDRRRRPNTPQHAPITPQHATTCPNTPQLTPGAPSWPSRSRSGGSSPPEDLTQARSPSPTHRSRPTAAAC